MIYCSDRLFGAYPLSTSGFADSATVFDLAVATIAAVCTSVVADSAPVKPAELTVIENSSELSLEASVISRSILVASVASAEALRGSHLAVADCADVTDSILLPQSGLPI